MGRKNYSTKQARRSHYVEYVVEDMRGDYDVTLTNGVDFTTIVYSGTSVSCWTKAIREGKAGEIDDGGYWWPVEINATGQGKPIFSVI